MRNIISPDAPLAKFVEGGELALLFDSHTLTDQTVDALTTFSPDTKVEDSSNMLVIGRSALGIAGVDIFQANAAVRRNGHLLVPIGVDTHTEIGSQLVSRLYDLASDPAPGERVMYNNHELAFGRLVNTACLEQLTGDEIADAFSQNLIAIESDGGQTDVQIEDDELSLPLQPYELITKDYVLGRPEILLSMLEAGKSAREFLWNHTSPQYRNGIHTMASFIVGPVIFSPGPFFGEVVAAISDKGILPQLPSAAWLDENRSSGLRNNQQPGHRGRQIEVVNPDPVIVHAWAGARVAIRLYRPSPDSNQRYMKEWASLTNEQRLERHFSGYGGV